MTEDSAPSRAGRRLGRRFIVLGVIVLGGGGFWLWQRLTYPSDHTPEGAYLRIMIAVNRGRPTDVFPYIETRAQHACYTIRDFRKRARARVLAAYPEPERSRLAKSYAAEAAAADGAAIFQLFAEREGWLSQLRRDLSGIHSVVISGERATVETVKGTRYPFRRRPNGIWGLTLFTARLSAEAEKAARDFTLIDRAASDYERAGAPQHGPEKRAP
jgi:hypothetical protein